MDISLIRDSSPFLSETEPIRHETPSNNLMIPLGNPTGQKREQPPHPRKQLQQSPLTDQSGRPASIMKRKKMKKSNIIVPSDQDYQTLHPLPKESDKAILRLQPSLPVKDESSKPSEQSRTHISHAPILACNTSIAQENVDFDMTEQKLQELLDLIQNEQMDVSECPSDRMIEDIFFNGTPL